ncbi:hypothetical protein KIPB_008269 [Kipferlia bialata]|uniref:Uncharacterized protein n=1 Tax=Kipferlia bialata TaxID=797122 RepID=A0A391NN32_9EUKA|nr:hypothetical protein KIPB_003522 [Kipferlia bialata]GCA63171.1 hypothetical protein KIPB_008269 [Kipferlia bialata]|eukprot:g3522.t1
MNRYLYGMFWCATPDVTVWRQADGEGPQPTKVQSEYLEALRKASRRRPLFGHRSSPPPPLPCVPHDALDTTGMVQHRQALLAYPGAFLRHCIVPVVSHGSLSQVLTAAGLVCNVLPRVLVRGGGSAGGSPFRGYEHVLLSCVRAVAAVGVISQPDTALRCGAFISYVVSATCRMGDEFLGRVALIYVAKALGVYVERGLGPLRSGAVKTLSVLLGGVFQDTPALKADFLGLISCLAAAEKSILSEGGMVPPLIRRMQSELTRLPLDTTPAPLRLPSAHSPRDMNLSVLLDLEEYLLHLDSLHRADSGEAEAQAEAETEAEVVGAGDVQMEGEEADQDDAPLPSPPPPDSLGIEIGLGTGCPEAAEMLGSTQDIATAQSEVQPLSIITSLRPILPGALVVTSPSSPLASPLPEMVSPSVLPDTASGTASDKAEVQAETETEKPVSEEVEAFVPASDVTEATETVPQSDAAEGGVEQLALGTGKREREAEEGCDGELCPAAKRPCDSVSCDSHKTASEVTGDTHP